MKMINKRKDYYNEIDKEILSIENVSYNKDIKIDLSKNFEKLSEYINKVKKNASPEFFSFLIKKFTSLSGLRNSPKNFHFNLAILLKKITEFSKDQFGKELCEGIVLNVLAEGRNYPSDSVFKYINEIYDVKNYNLDLFHQVNEMLIFSLMTYALKDRESQDKNKSTYQALENILSNIKKNLSIIKYQCNLSYLHSISMLCEEYLFIFFSFSEKNFNEKKDFIQSYIITPFSKILKECKILQKKYRYYYLIILMKYFNFDTGTIVENLLLETNDIEALAHYFLKMSDYFYLSKIFEENYVQYLIKSLYVKPWYSGKNIKDLSNVWDDHLFKKSSLYEKFAIQFEKYFECFLGCFYYIIKKKDFQKKPFLNIMITNSLKIFDRKYSKKNESEEIIAKVKIIQTLVKILEDDGNIPLIDWKKMFNLMSIASEVPKLKKEVEEISAIIIKKTSLFEESILSEFVSNYWNLCQNSTKLFEKKIKLELINENLFKKNFDKIFDILLQLENEKENYIFSLFFENIFFYYNNGDDILKTQIENTIIKRFQCSEKLNSSVLLGSKILFLQFLAETKKLDVFKEIVRELIKNREDAGLIFLLEVFNFINLKAQIRKLQIVIDIIESLLQGNLSEKGIQVNLGHKETKFIQHVISSITIRSDYTFIMKEGTVIPKTPISYAVIDYLRKGKDGYPGYAVLSNIIIINFIFLFLLYSRNENNSAFRIILKEKIKSPFFVKGIQMNDLINDDMKKIFVKELLEKSEKKELLEDLFKLFINILSQYPIREDENDENTITTYKTLLNFLLSLMDNLRKEYNQKQDEINMISNEQQAKRMSEPLNKLKADINLDIIPSLQILNFVLFSLTNYKNIEEFKTLIQDAVARIIFSLSYLKLNSQVGLEVLMVFYFCSNLFLEMDKKTITQIIYILLRLAFINKPTNNLKLLFSFLFNDCFLKEIIDVKGEVIIESPSKSLITLAVETLKLYLSKIDIPCSSQNIVESNLNIDDCDFTSEKQKHQSLIAVEILKFLFTSKKEKFYFENKVNHYSNNNKTFYYGNNTLFSITSKKTATHTIFYTDVRNLVKNYSFTYYKENEKDFPSDNTNLLTKLINNEDESKLSKQKLRKIDIEGVNLLKENNKDANEPQTQASLEETKTFLNEVFSSTEKIVSKIKPENLSGFSKIIEELNSFSLFSSFKCDVIYVTSEKTKGEECGAFFDFFEKLGKTISSNEEGFPSKIKMTSLEGDFFYFYLNILEETEQMPPSYKKNPITIKFLETPSEEELKKKDFDFLLYPISKEFFYFKVAVERNYKDQKGVLKEFLINVSDEYKLIKTLLLKYLVFLIPYRGAFEIENPLVDGSMLYDKVEKRFNLLKAFE